LADGQARHQYSIKDRIRAAPSAYRSTGGWAEKPAHIRPQLEESITADVVVVGAGFAGLSTALELTALGADVVVLEREFGGFGASGCNAGYLAGAHGLDYAAIIKTIGREQAKQIVAYFEEGIAYVERKLAEHSIDCDYLPSGLIGAAVHPSQEKAMRSKMDLAVELGAPAQFLDSAAMRAREIPPAFLSGVLAPGGTLNPGKYVQGLRRATIDADLPRFFGPSLV